MPLIIPERTTNFPGHDYGLKVLDPVDGSEVFNAKYPIFGSDITNDVDQIISRRIEVTNSSGKFSEPATPSISWVNDGNWKNTTYNQLNNQIIATIPHGQDKVPQFMVTGYAYVRRTMRLRYWHKDKNGSMTYNTVYNAQGGYRANSIPPQLGGPENMLPYPTGFESFEFKSVGPYGSGSSTYGNVVGSSMTITADATNIYIRQTITQRLNHQRLRASGYGWDRYEKYWHDLTGSWYQLTFYILPYDKGEDIFIR